MVLAKSNNTNCKFILRGNCCGCFACLQICPQHSISIHEDDEGFNYPITDFTTCINCGLCKKVCPVQNTTNHNKKDPIIVLAAQNKKDSIVKYSSSGGIFSFLAEKTLSQNGIVYGAAFDKNWEAHHIGIEHIQELQQLRTSKYIQSDTSTAYISVKEHLDQNRKVLFSGTPCQISGLTHFLKKDYPNLITLDVVCHGVPSSILWRRHLKDISSDKKFRNQQIVAINFRDKREHGWKDFSLSIIYTHGQYSCNHHNDAFMNLFLKNMCLRRCCYNCQFKKNNSGADITLGDFWGIDKLFPNIDNKGTSLVIVNTNRGNSFLDTEDIISKKVSLDDAILHNPAYTTSVSMPKKRSRIFKELKRSTKTFHEFSHDFLSPPFLLQIVLKLKSITLTIATAIHKT